MADLKFNCPHCSQTITCDELWAGHELQCPACKGAISVPTAGSEAAPSLVPKPPEAPARLSIGRPQHTPAPAPHAAGGSKFPAGNPMARKPAAPAKKQGGAKKILTYSVAFLVCAVGGYFGVTYVMQLQEKANEKRRAAERNADGGEMGHIANLYDVLDRTEPGGRGLGSTPRASGPRAQPGTRAIDVPPAQTPADPAAANKALPVVPPVYALETVTTNIPESRVNGMISGTNFLADTVRIDSAGTAQVLRFIQGTPASPDRELLIYLHPKPAEKISGHTWTIKADQRGSDVPQVVKRAKINPKYAATSKSFPYGYAMTLELGPTTNTTAVGKIYIALPDAEKSVVAGVFTASTTPSVDAAISTITTPAATAPSSPQNAAFQQRYGIKR